MSKSWFRRNRHAVPEEVRNEHQSGRRAGVRSTNRGRTERSHQRPPSFVPNSLADEKKPFAKRRQYTHDNIIIRVMTTPPRREDASRKNRSWVVYSANLNIANDANTTVLFQDSVVIR